MNDPATPSPPPADTRGSLIGGFFLAWPALIGSYIFCGVLLASLNIDNANAILLLLSLPWAMVFGLIFWFAQKGKTQTAKGIAIGLASIVAITLLLIAACFSLFTGIGFH